jgi:hypothetical protein
MPRYFRSFSWKGATYLVSVLMSSVLDAMFHERLDQMVLRRWLVTLAVLTVALTSGSLISGTANAESTPAGGVRPNGICDATGWSRDGALIMDVTSPWIATRPGFSPLRDIRFHHSTGYWGKWTDRNCVVHRARFSGATQYEVRDCRNQGLFPHVCDPPSGWLTVPANAPAPGFQYPNQYVGYDIFTSTFRVWGNM